MDDMTEKEMRTVKMSTLYELRLIFKNGEKKEYTTDEIVEILDKIALAKDQERLHGRLKNRLPYWIYAVA